MDEGVPAHHQRPLRPRFRQPPCCRLGGDEFGARPRGYGMDGGRRSELMEMGEGEGRRWRKKDGMYGGGAETTRWTYT